MRLWVMGAMALLGACATPWGGGDDETASLAPEATLLAIQNARINECPVGRTLENARFSSDVESVGVETVDIALTPLASDPSRAVRLRRLTVAPGGVIAWHDHRAVQGMALVVSGEMTEFRNTCLDPIRYRAGDVAREDAATAHGWRNAGSSPAVIITAHVIPRQ